MSCKLHKGRFRWATPFRISGSRIINQTSLHFKVKYSTHDLIYRLFHCHLTMPRKQVFLRTVRASTREALCVCLLCVYVCVSMCVPHAYQITRVRFCLLLFIYRLTLVLGCLAELEWCEQCWSLTMRVCVWLAIFIDAAILLVVFVSFSIAFKIVSASLTLFKNMVLLSVCVDKCVYLQIHCRGSSELQLVQSYPELSLPTQAVGHWGPKVYQTPWRYW